MKIGRYIVIVLVCLLSAGMHAEDRVLAAARDGEARKDVPAELELSLQEAQDYAIKQNRSLKNASILSWPPVISMIRLSLDTSTILPRNTLAIVMICCL